jgi:beta-barrel assembly-enhancing protease
MKKINALILLACIACPLPSVQALDIALPEMGDSAGALISPQQEHEIGQSFFWRLQQSVELIDDPEVNSYLQALGYRLVSNSDAPYLNFTFFMVPDPTVNAFAAPGGFIGINSGLILTSQREDEVASVIAHEIAHITQRHLLRSFEQSKQMSVPMTVAMIAAALLGATTNSQMGMGAIMAVQAGGVQAQINFTRANESEADNIGMLTLVRAGFDPQAMPTFFERLQQTSRFYTSSSVPEFLRTHPVTTARIADARGRAASYPSKQQHGDNLQFYLIREKLRVLASKDLNQLTQFYVDEMQSGSSLNETATQYGYSLALTAKGDYTMARTVIQKLIDKDKDRLSYQLALADLEVAVGRIPAALTIYDDNQKLYPDDQALTLEQVGVLLKANQPVKAVALLQTQFEIGSPPRPLYKLMSQAKAAMGEKSQSHSWLAEYYYNSGRLEQAADQLRVAAGFAKHDEYQLSKITARLREVEMALKQMDDELS